MSTLLEQLYLFVLELYIEGAVCIIEWHLMEQTGKKWNMIFISMSYLVYIRSI